MNEDLTTNNSSIKMVDVNTFVTSIVNKNIKNILNKLNVLVKDQETLKKRMDEVERNIVLNLQSAVFMGKIAAEVKKLLGVD